MSVSGKGRLGVLLIGERCPLAGRWQAQFSERAPHPIAAVRRVQEPLMLNRLPCGELEALASAGAAGNQPVSSVMSADESLMALARP